MPALRRRPVVQRLVLVFASVLVTLTLLEVAAALTLRHPAVLRYAPAKLLSAFRGVYGRLYRSILQAESCCADPGLPAFARGLTVAVPRPARTR